MNIIETIEGFERSRDKHSRAKFEAVRDTMRRLVDLNNTMACEKEVLAGLVAGLVNEHPHLQHKTILALLNALGEIGLLDRRVDDRNRFARGLCSKLRESLRDELFWKDV